MDVEPSLCKTGKVKSREVCCHHVAWWVMASGLDPSTQTWTQGHFRLIALRPLKQGGWTWAGRGGEGVGLSHMAWRRVLLLPGQRLGHQVTALHGGWPFFLACASISRVPPGFKIATPQSNLNAWSMVCLGPGDGWLGLSWLIHLCLYNVFVTQSSDVSKPTSPTWHLGIVSWGCVLGMGLSVPWKGKWGSASVWNYQRSPHSNKVKIVDQDRREKRTF